MGSLDELLRRLEELIEEIERLDEPVRGRVFELLDGVDAVHRLALGRLAEALGPERLDALRRADPAIGWLLDAYGVGTDQRAAAEAALDAIRPYIHSHGGKVEVLGATGGVVRVRLSGACSGCTASTITLQRGIEEALRANLPWFAGVEVEQDEAEAHPPPGPTLLQLRAGPPGRGPVGAP